MAKPSARPGAATPSTSIATPRPAPTSRLPSNRQDLTCCTHVSGIWSYEVGIWDRELMKRIPNSKFPTTNSYVVCGPTASGKSELSDVLAEKLTERRGRRVPTVVVDSMQFKRKFPILPTRPRRRPPGLVAVVWLVKGWAVGPKRHVWGSSSLR